MTTIKSQIEALIEQLPISQQNDYEIALIGIELQEYLYDECKKDLPTEVDNIRKRIDAFEMLIELREQTRKIMSGLTEEQQVASLGKSKTLRSIITKNRQKNENQNDTQTRTGSDNQ